MSRRIYTLFVAALLVVAAASSCFLPDPDSIYPEDGEVGPDDDDSAEEVS